MHLMEPARCVVGIAQGALAGATGHYVKRLGDLAGLYADAAAFGRQLERRGDAPVYEVSEYRPSEAAGDIIFGVTRMMAGKIGREYFMTRGHIHTKADRPEIYYGEAGHGVMLLEAPDGDIRVVPMEPRAICYVPPYWIHRSINIGVADLVMTFAYPADSGQDYGIIEASGGMRQRIVDDGKGGWMATENEGYRRRPAAQIARIFDNI